MTTLMHRLMGSTAIYREAPDMSGGAGGEGAAATPESVLFPNEGSDKSGEGDGNGKEGDGSDTAGQGDWKEYVNDPAKSAEENAAAKAEHDKSKPAGDDKSKDDPANQVPADGKYELTMPEGVQIDQQLLDAVSPRFKELGLTKAQAQALTDDFIKIQQQRAEEHAKSPEGAWSASAFDYFKQHGTPDKWADTAKADKEIGGDKWNTTVQNATRFMNAYATPGLKDFMNASGGGNHPELIRVFAKAGELIREDNPASGGASGAEKPAEPAHVLFPNDAPKG